MTSFHLQNFISAPVLFFGLGVLAGLLRSNLTVPRGVGQFLSLYLMMAIGLKGGLALSGAAALTFEFAGIVAFGVLFGLLQPVLGVFLLKRTTTLDAATAAATAAHYGSVSIVTFATAVSLLDINHIAYAGYIVAVVAIMEAPAIVSGLMLARTHNDKQGLSHILIETATNGAVVLLLGAFLIGMIIGPENGARLTGFFIDPFQGVLCLFLLDMGLIVSRNLKQVRQFTPSLLAFGIYMPLLGAALGLGASRVLGLDQGTTVLFTTLCASASYIAVPAAMRTALPEANPAIYLPLSLGVTFPFNVLIGLPLFHYLASL